MDKLTVSLVQFDIEWENPAANRAILEEQIHELENFGDLILLPEMFNTGFSSNAKEFAEPMNFTTHKWMKQIAAHTQAFVGGSLMIKEGDAIFNRFLLVAPDGKTEYYDKKHLFRMSEEIEIFKPGSEKKIFEVKGWKICPLICYDLRFPVWSRNENLAYDLLIYTANWPASRDFVWNTLLAARALENQAYVIGINRIGQDGMGIDYCGNSVVIDAKGTILGNAKGEEQIIQVAFSKSELNTFREKFPVYKDADGFVLKP